MRTVAREAFAVWITGLPASGKSTLAKALAAKLAERGIDVAVLESDELRKVLTPDPHYDERERERFYGQMNYIGALLVRHGVSVIFDATANRRAWRSDARRNIARFMEVYVKTRIEVCVARDPKGIYQQAREGNASAVPGLQADYEAPENPEIAIDGDIETPESAASRILMTLVERGYISSAG